MGSRTRELTSENIKKFLEFSLTLEKMNTLKYIRILNSDIR